MKAEILDLRFAIEEGTAAQRPEPNHKSAIAIRKCHE
jgi:hypothetical protein